MAKIKEFTQADVKAEDILKNELVILHGLQFHLLVYHPYRSLYAFVNDKEFTSVLVKQNADELYEKGKEAIKATFGTDASFLYPPGMIALASFYHHSPEDRPALLT